MALKLRKRHTDSCRQSYGDSHPDATPLSRYDGRVTRCKCHYAVTGTLPLDGTIRASTGEADYERARKIAATWEEAGTTHALPPPEPPADPTDTHATLEYAKTEFGEGYIEAKKLAKGTRRGYGTMLNFLTTYAEKKGLRFVDEFTLARLQDWQKGWGLNPRSAGKRLELTRCFFEFCVDREWITKNPTKKIKVPRSGVNQKDPFTDEEMAAILQACERYPTKNRQSEAPRITALALLMRYGGLRISDASFFTAPQLDTGDRANYYPIKSNKEGSRQMKMVTVKLPAWVADQLRALPLIEGKYLFTTGHGSERTVTDVWRKKFERVFDRAREIIREQRGDPEWDWPANPHPHRFRHTFAIFMLEHDVSVQDVADLLGHSDPRITLRHYRKWVPGLQARLDAVVDDVYQRASKPKPVKGKAKNAA